MKARGAAILAPMTTAPAALIRDFLAWLDAAPRPYAEAMEAWRTSCPRLTVWEDAVDEGLVARRAGGASGVWVELTAKGRAWLAAGRSDDEDRDPGRLVRHARGPALLR
jgi:hypothetical protein